MPSIVVAPEPEPGAPVFAVGTLEQTLAAVSRIGYDAVELRLRHPADVDAAALRRALARGGLTLRALLTGPAAADGLSLSDSSRAGEALRRVAGMLELAEPHGADLVLSWLLGPLPQGPRRSDAEATLVESLAACRELAERRGARLLLEPVNRYEPGAASTVAAVTELSERAGGGFWLLLDLFHMNIEEADMVGVARNAAPAVAHVHLADSNRRVIGQGHVPARAVVDALRDGGFTGTFGVEALLGAEPELGAAAALPRARSFERACASVPLRG